MYVHMYICMYICTYYVHLILLHMSGKYKDEKIKATATFYDLCVLRNFDSSEQYLSAKWAIIDTPTVPRYSIHGSRLQPPISGHPRPCSILNPWKEDEDVHWQWLEPRTINRVLDLIEGFLEELKLVLDLDEVFVEELKLVVNPSRVF